jgi:hypothetical protein
MYYFKCFPMPLVYMPLSLHMCGFSTAALLLMLPVRSSVGLTTNFYVGLEIDDMYTTFS